MKYVQVGFKKKDDANFLNDVWVSTGWKLKPGMTVYFKDNHTEPWVVAWTSKHEIEITEIWSVE